VTTALSAFRSLLAQARLDEDHLGTPHWNPLGEIINEGQKVLVKPNWVYHQNASGHGLDCLVTHPSVLEAALHYIVKARPRKIVLGDAPIQGCDFKTLMDRGGFNQMIDRLSTYGINVELKDFRRTIRPDSQLATQAEEECKPLSEFVLYDIGADSALEEITRNDSEFRVTMYNPASLKRTHGPAKHQYLVARDVIDSDVVFNVPKLKTHQKACITGALKNLVGINGHKEYLPHHRMGAPLDGGDCYAEQSSLKSLVERLLDATNQARGQLSRVLLANAVRAGMGFGKLLSVDGNYEGAWHGNDTIWRTVLDLQRILRFGRVDGTLAETPQRTVLTVTDAIIAGEGDGPLAPTPIDLGMLIMGTSTAAVEWVNALLMGLLPQHLSLTREAFSRHRFPLANFGPCDISVFVDGDSVALDELYARYGRSFRLPKGWQCAHSHITSESVE